MSAGDLLRMELAGRVACPRASVMGCASADVVDIGARRLVVCQSCGAAEGHTGKTLEQIQERLGPPADPPTATPEQGKAASQIERFTVYKVVAGQAHAKGDPNGDWVRYEDHAGVLADLIEPYEHAGVKRCKVCGGEGRKPPSPLSLADVPRWVFTSSHGRERFNPDFDRHMGLRRFVSEADIEALLQRLEKEKRAAEHRANVAEPALTAETARANAMEARAEQAEASLQTLLDVLNEVRTNGAWSKGEGVGEWSIGAAVYAMVGDALLQEEK